MISSSRRLRVIACAALAAGCGGDVIPEGDLVPASAKDVEVRFHPSRGTYDVTTAEGMVVAEATADALYEEAGVRKTFSCAGAHIAQGVELGTVVCTGDRLALTLRFTAMLDRALTIGLRAENRGEGA